MAQTIGSTIGMVGSISKHYEGKKMQKKAQKAIDNHRWETRTNPYDTLSVSTLGADLRKEQTNVNTATYIDALQSGGTRSVMGGVGRVQAQNNTIDQQIAADLDQQQKRIDFAKSQQDVYNQNVIEKRQSNELAGYGQMMNVGMGMKYQGYADAQAIGQSQSQHNMEIMQMVMGGMGGGAGAGSAIQAPTASAQPMQTQGFQPSFNSNDMKPINNNYGF